MKTVFITGGTGVVGSALVPRLLEERETRVRLLIRARSDEHLEQRLRQLFEFWRWEAEDLSFGGRLRAYRGDACQTRLGLDERQYHRLAGEVTHIVHAAGNVKLDQSLAEARRSAVGAAKQIVEFSRLCQATGNFHKLEFVSTVGVAGRMTGMVPERPLSEPRDFHNTYEQAKAEAEEYLLNEMRHGLPATIHRPSMVVGDSQNGKTIRFQVFYHLCEFLSGRRTRGIIPDLGNARLDIIPVDYVAQAILIAMSCEEAAGRVFHLSSGLNRSIHLEQLLEQVRDIFTRYLFDVPQLRTVQRGALRPIVPVISLLARRRKWRALRGLPELLRYLRTCQSQSFETADTVDFLSRHGLAPPPAGRTLVGAVLDYYCTAKTSVAHDGTVPRAHVKQAMAGVDQ